jgi:RimJ/RimL family protein N-acetyltransferase
LSANILDVFKKKTLPYYESWGNALGLNMDLAKGIDELKDYLSWMRNEKANPFIQGVTESYSTEDLVAYITEKNHSETALLLGIFVKPENTHIGNVKLEPIIPGKSAVIGILIGEENFRGKGVGFEVITRVLEFCFTELELEFVELGVNKKNLRAIALYTRLGFTENTQKSSSHESIKMLISRSTPK